MRQPFVGTSGRYLRATLANSGLATDQLFFGNICQHNPPSNDIDNFDFDGEEIQTGIEQLRKDLSTFRPNCILLLGKTAFRAFRGDLCYPTKQGYYVPLVDWRGSVVNGQFGDVAFKCICTYHPAYILRAYGDAPLFKFDVARAARHSRFPELRATSRNGNLRPSLAEVLSFIGTARAAKQCVTWDIEGYADSVGITMLSLCTSASEGIVVPFYIDSQNYWSEEEEVQVWSALADLLADPLVPKCAHNAFYELFVSAWRHRLIINNLRDDTMMKHWELFPESGGDPEDTDTGKKRRQGIGRDLGTCCSIYTEQPFYKAGRLSTDTTVKLQYNLLDSLVTHEINDVVERKLIVTPRSHTHYRFNINLIPAYNYLMLRGCRIDTERLATLENSTQEEISTLSAEIDGQILEPAITADVVTRKRKSDPYHFNVDSGNQLRWLLFTHLQYKPSARRVTETGKQKTDEDTLLSYWTKHRDPLLRLIIRLVRKRTRLSDIHKLVTNEDGRIRSRLDPVGTNTGRLSSSKSQALRLTSEGWENTGTNLQNVTKELRAVFIPDDPTAFDFWQADLQGADAWTVACDLAALGFPAMLEDILAGIKPALLLYYIIQEHSAGRDPSTVNRIPRAELKIKLKEIKREIDSLDGKVDGQGRPADWQYLCCKRIQHGSNYGAQPEKISEVIFGDSDGTIDLSKREATLYQHFYKLRYQTDHRNESIRRKLSAEGALVAACGIRRQFFGIRNRYDIDDAIVREASSFEPQANTTWATNKALERLWYDPSNRQSTGALHVEPLLQIHDALAGQYRQRDRDWAHSKLREWFSNPLTIGGTQVTIPADGKWGTDWKNCKESFL